MSQSTTKSPIRNAPNIGLRYDWSRQEVEEFYHRPLLDLVFAAQQVHRQFHDPAMLTPIQERMDAVLQLPDIADPQRQLRSEFVQRTQRLRPH